MVRREFLRHPGNCLSRQEVQMSKKSHVYTPAFKFAAIERMRQGENLGVLARELGVKRRLLYEWRRALDQGRPLRMVGRPRIHDVSAVTPNVTAPGM